MVESSVNYWAAQAPCSYSCCFAGDHDSGDHSNPASAEDAEADGGPSVADFAIMVLVADLVLGYQAAFSSSYLAAEDLGAYDWVFGGVLDSTGSDHKVLVGASASSAVQVVTGHLDVVDEI